MPFNYQLFSLAVPAALVVLVGIVARSIVRLKRASVLLMSVLTLGLVLLLIRNPFPPTFFPDSSLVFLTIPTVIGMLGILVLPARSHRVNAYKEMITIPAYVLLICALLVIVMAAGDPFSAYFVLVPAVAVVLTWSAWEWRGGWRIFSLIVAFILLIGASDLIPMVAAASLPIYLQIGYGIYVTSWPIVAVVLAARTLFGIFADGELETRISVALRLLMASLLILSVHFQISYAGLWDTMTDGLGSIFLAQFATFGAIAAAMLLAWTLQGKRRWAALVFALVALFTFADALDNGMRVSPVAVTEQRADQVNQAVMGYYSRNARYPGTLANLVPLYLARIPEPIMIRGLTWCYESGSNYYRLGYVYHKWFDGEASVRIAGAAGFPPNPAWQCDADALNYNSEYPRH